MRVDYHAMDGRVGQPYYHPDAQSCCRPQTSNVTDLSAPAASVVVVVVVVVAAGEMAHVEMPVLEAVPRETSDGACHHADARNHDLQ